MIWVRLIGGIANGRVVKVDPDQVEHIAQERVPVAMAHRPTTLGSISSEVKRSRYTRREVRTPEGSVVFFADADLSDFAAINSVLGP
ncbi:hypothetical protein PMI42_01686 [Bradyrhizobium sp. YR681]|uniref:hypothetical protein n=1 Tax=Bradyrhizobium sp. YR681 TaxID=1144344 RepID=UPI0002712A39|nr:hypothetical protein [Bradyrhizobium sp. YR681]EJN14713.1 hypothetical protein PMI42_01686 [Bradyrhizobium sp. YR681]